MESSKANTVGIVKIFLPCVYTIRKTLRACSGLLFSPQNGKDGINHLLLLELPYLRINQRRKDNKVKNDTLLKARDPQKP